MTTKTQTKKQSTDAEMETSDDASECQDLESEQQQKFVKTKKTKSRKRSPGDFVAHSEAVAEEHALHGTTSIDEKISKDLRLPSINVPSNDSDDQHSEPAKQEDYRSDEDDDEESNAPAAAVRAVESKNSFFAPSDGVSFHANSFMELNLSRPLVRACQALGYDKPTPIQAACIPLALTGRDIYASAIAGWKDCCFLVA